VPLARAKEYDPVVSVLGSELCRRILRLLLVDPHLDLDAGALSRLLGVHPRTISVRLNDLARAALLAKQRRGQFMSYRAVPGLQATLETMILVPPSGDGFPSELICILYGSRSVIYRGKGA
jgi:DNA-binding transcriptional ArsR family regulator